MKFSISKYWYFTFKYFFNLFNYYLIISPNIEKKTYCKNHIDSFPDSIITDCNTEM